MEMGSKRDINIDGGHSSQWQSDYSRRHISLGELDPYLYYDHGQPYRPICTKEMAPRRFDSQGYSHMILKLKTQLFR
jgi:hypothetical protein